jgi:hypothetical protein
MAYRGSHVELRFSIVVDGAPTDGSSVKCIIRSPHDDSRAPVSLEVHHDSVGEYRATFFGDVLGLWHWRWEATITRDGRPVVLVDEGAEEVKRSGVYVGT